MSFIFKLLLYAEPTTLLSLSLNKNVESVKHLPEIVFLEGREGLQFEGLIFLSQKKKQ